MEEEDLECETTASVQTLHSLSSPGRG